MLKLLIMVVLSVAISEALFAVKQYRQKRRKQHPTRFRREHRPSKPRFDSQGDCSTCHHTPCLISCTSCTLTPVNCFPKTDATDPFVDTALVRTAADKLISGKPLPRAVPCDDFDEDRIPGTSVKFVDDCDGCDGNHCN